MSRFRSEQNKKENNYNRMPRYKQELEENKNASYAAKLIDNDRITKRIVQYVDDPENSNAIAKIRRLSEKSKSRRNSPKNSDEEIENTEKNRLLFKNEKEEEERPIFRGGLRKFHNNKKVHFDGGKNNKTIDNIRIKKLTDEDEDDVKPKNNNIEYNKPKSIIHFDDYKTKNNKNNENDNENNNINIVDNYRSKKFKDNDNRFNKYNKSRNENDSDKNNNEDNYKEKYNTVDNDYDLKNSEVVESHHNKDKIIVNEYRTKSKNKNDLKNYKTEYVWDKNINRLVEKRIYTDEDNNKRNDNQNNDYNNNYKNESKNENENNNRYKYGKKKYLYENKDEDKEKEKEEKEDKNNYRYDKKNEEKYNKDNDNIDKNNKRKYDDKENKDKENEEVNKPYIKKKKEEIKKEKIEPENINGNDTKVIEVRKRVGNCQVLFKMPQKSKKNKDDNRVNPRQLNNNNIYKKGKINTSVDDKKKKEPKDFIGEEKQKYQIKKPNNSYSENKTIIKDISSGIKPKIGIKIYKKRQFIPDKDDFKIKIPKTSFGGKKYMKRPPYSLAEPGSKVIYTKKIIEEKKPDKKEVKEIIIEKEYDDKKNNIRIQVTTEKLDEDGNNIKSTFQKYTNDSRNPKTNKMYVTSKTQNDYDNYENSTDMKFAPSYDNINEIIEEDYGRNFTGINNYEIKPDEYVNERPIYKKKIQIEERYDNN